MRGHGEDGSKEMNKAPNQKNGEIGGRHFIRFSVFACISLHFVYFMSKCNVDHDGIDDQYYNI